MQADFRDLTVVIPTYNEAGNIEKLICQLYENLNGVSIVVVDDQSKDETAAIVRKLMPLHSTLQLIERTSDPCLTRSIEEGVRTAKSAYVGWLDADLSHPPALFQKLYLEAQGSGCCLATRFSREVAAEKISAYSDNILSSMLSYILNLVVYNLLRLPITDYTSGFIVVRRSLLENYRFKGDYGEYFIHLCFYLFHQQKIQISEVPYVSPPREWGESKTGTTLLKLSRRGSKYLWMVFLLTLQKFSLFKMFPAALDQKKS